MWVSWIMYFTGSKTWKVLGFYENSFILRKYFLWCCLIYVDQNRIFVRFLFILVCSKSLWFTTSTIISQKVHDYQFEDKTYSVFKKNCPFSLFLQPILRIHIAARDFLSSQSNESVHCTVNPIEWQFFVNQYSSLVLAGMRCQNFENY